MASKKSGEILISEIKEQPSAIRDTVNAVDLSGLELHLGKPMKRIILLGMGSSYYAALYGQYLFSQVAKTQAQAVLSSDILYYPPVVGKEDLVITISQSGETVETVKACRTLRERGFRNILTITNTEGSTLTKMTDLSIVTRAGVEKASATKTYLSTLAVLNLLARFIECRNVDSSLDVLRRVRANLLRVADFLELHMDEWSAIYENIAEVFLRASTRFLLGRGFNVATVMAGSLLFKEAAKIWVEACEAAEFRHEALELVRKTFSAVLITTDSTKDVTIKLASSLRRLGGDVIQILPEDLRIPEKLGEELTVFPYTVLVQLASYSSALKRGVDPDIFAVMTKVTLEE